MCYNKSMEQMKTLTDAQRTAIWSRTYSPSRAILDTALRYARAIEAAIAAQAPTATSPRCESCAYGAPSALPVQTEPVASIYITTAGQREFDDWPRPLPAGRNIHYAEAQQQPDPAAREPLKVSAIEELAVQEQLFLVCDGLDELVEIVRIIEMAHNITGEQK